MCRGFVGNMTRGRGVFGASVSFKVNGEETTEYDPRTFYTGKLHGKQPPWRLVEMRVR